MTWVWQFGIPSPTAKLPEPPYSFIKEHTSAAGTGNQYAYVEFTEDVELNAIEVLNDSAVGLEITFIYIQRGPLGDSSKDACALKCGWTKNYNQLIWTGSLKLKGPFRVLGVVRHITSISHMIRILGWKS